MRTDLPILLPPKEKGGIWRKAWLFIVSEPGEFDLSECITLDVVEYDKARKHICRFKIPNIEHALILRDDLDERIRIWRKNLSKRIGRKR